MRIKFIPILTYITRRFKNVLWAGSSIVLVLLILELFSFSEAVVNDTTPFNQNYKIFPAPLPDTINFAGEKVPMNHLGVRENLEQEILINTYWQSQTLLMLKRANRYFPTIEQLLKKYGIPNDFKYIALAESGFSYKVSPAGAAGFWQLLKGTAQAYNLEVNKDIDERYNLEKSTEAACRYFKDAYEQFHNWTLAAASYNLGIAGVEREIEKQKENNYYDLELNTETARYIYRILAIKELVSYPRRFGFFIKNSDLYPPIPVTIMPVDSTITNLADFAICKGINYRVLKLLNPWLLTDKLPNANRHIYALSIPEKNVPFLDLGENITFADSLAHFADVTQKKDSAHAKIIIHVVKQGENIESIAKQYNVSAEQLRIWNSISDTLKIKPKDELMIFMK